MALVGEWKDRIPKDRVLKDRAREDRLHEDRAQDYQSPIIVLQLGQSNVGSQRYKCQKVKTLIILKYFSDMNCKKKNKERNLIRS